LTREKSIGGSEERKEAEVKVEMTAEKEGAGSATVERTDAEADAGADDGLAKDAVEVSAVLVVGDIRLMCTLDGS